MVARDDADGASHLAGPFACFGQRWRIVCDDPAFARLVAELYAPMLVASAPVGRTVTYRLAATTGDQPVSLPRASRALTRKP